MMNDPGDDGQAQAGAPGAPEEAPDAGDGHASHPAGLCGGCVHLQVVTSHRGSQFFLCRLSAIDPAFPRYPPIPVVSCAGFVRSAARG